MKKYLVTGATGFVGSWVTRELVKRGEDVSILVRNKDLNWRLKEVAENIHVYTCDLQNPALKEVIDTIKPHVVFHTAAAGATPSQNLTVNSLLDVNVKGLVNLLDAIKKHDIQRFINTGSSSEYGIKNNPMTEEDALEPINDYGVSKAAATLYAQRLAKIENLPITTLRLFSPYGYFDDEKRLISYVVTQSLKGETIALSSKDFVRDFIYIEDVVAAYFAAEKSNVNPGEIFNIGSGKQHSVYDIVKQITELTRSKAEISWGAMPKQSRQVEPKLWQADITKAKKILSWEPRYSLVEGLEKTISYFKKSL